MNIYSVLITPTPIQGFSSCLDFLFKLGAKWIINVALFGFWIVERGSVVRSEVDALLNSVGQVWGGNEIAAKDDGDVLVLVLLVDGAPRGIWPVTTSEQDGARIAPGIDGEIELVGRFDISVARDPRLDEMDVGEVEFLEALDNVCELRDGIVHLHALEARPGAQPDADLIRPDGVDDGAGDLEPEARAVLDAAPVRVGAGVDHVLQELVDEVAVCAVDLDAVEPGGDGVARRAGVVTHELLDFGRREFVRHGVFRVQGRRGRGDDGDPLGLGALGVRGAPQGPELEVDVGALGVDGRGDALPRLELGVVVDPRNVGIPSRAVRDVGRFADQEGPWDRGALGVVCLHEREGHVAVVGAEPGQGSHDQAVLEGHGPDFERLKEARV